MVEKRESARHVNTYDFVLSHDDILDMMKDPTVQLDNPADDQEFYLYIRKPNDSHINLSLRTLRENDKLVIRFYKVTDTETDSEFTDVDVS